MLRLVNDILSAKGLLPRTGFGVDATLIAAPSSTKHVDGQLNPFIEPDFVAERVEKMQAGIRAKVEHPFRVIKRQFGFTRVRYRSLAKNTAQVVTLFALGNLWMARRNLVEAKG